jgi:LysR family transcriptional regulator, benzoate and cis,cis-muconate-responsive activator of ben and cat genes
MESRSLRYFHAVAEERSFRRAARRLLMTQPPLSREVRRLERELGTALFDRSTQPITLTPAGEVLAREAEAILGRIDRAAEVTRRLGDRRAHLRVSFLGAAANGLLPDAVRGFRADHPGVHLVLDEVESGPVGLAQLRQRRTDLVLVRESTTDPLLGSELILDEPFVAVLPDDHDLAVGTGPLRLGELGAEPFVFWTRSSTPSTVDAALLEFGRLGLDMHIAQEAHGVQTVLGLVAAGIGISLLPESVTRLHREGVTSRPLHPPRPTIPLYATWHAEAPGAPSAPIMPFVEALRHAARLTAEPTSRPASDSCES